MSLEFYIAWRYIKARRKGVFTLLTTLIAIGGITLGVASLIITLGVMSGFHKDIKDKILGISPHLIILKNSSKPFNEYADIIELVKKNYSDIVAGSPFTYGQIIIRNNQLTSGAIIKGIDYKSEENLVGLSKKISAGTIASGVLNDNEIIIGQELARNLNISVGKDIIVMSPGQSDLIPKMKKFKVAAFFHSGMYEYDANLCYVTLNAGQNLFSMNNAVSGIGFSLKNWEKASITQQQIQQFLTKAYWIRSWESMNYNLFAALKLEKIMMFIILALIIIVASFNIISNLLLLTVEKTKEIGVLSALGISKNKIGRIFFYEGLIIGLTGIILGLCLGIGLSYILSKYHFIHLPADVYYIDTLPVRIIPLDVFTIVGSTLLITLFSAIYPSYQVTKLDPLEAIRYG